MDGSLLYSYDGATPPKRTGSDHASIYPYGVFETGDADLNDWPSKRKRGLNSAI